ncbi:PST family polysaccharide transporter [Labrenzia sp. EL_208]|nr:PST family polysaccharide transporter [Labrenzia sp. EL_132]MBG6233408.1 PST family polysaccharide transporter [Labrenzia sp. EL_208]
MKTKKKPHDRDQIFDVEHLQYDIGARTSSSSIVSMFFALLKLVLAVGSTAILARLIPPAQHGLIALTMPVILLTSGFSEFGLAQVITQRSTLTHKTVSSLFWFTVALSLSLMLLLIAFGQTLSTFYREPDVAKVFRLLAPYVAFTGIMTVYIGILRRQLRVKILEICVFVATVTSLSVTILMAAFGFGVYALIAQLLLQQAGSLILLMFVTRWLPSNPLKTQINDIKHLLSFGAYLASERVLNDSVRAFQLAAIGRAFGDIAVGLYYRAEVLALMPQGRVISPLSAAFIPSLSRLQSNQSKFVVMFQRQISWGNILLVPIGAVFCTIPDMLVVLLLGPDWLDAIPVLRWLGVLSFSGLLISCLSWALVSAGKGSILLKYRITYSGLMICAILIALPNGLVATVATYAVSIALLGLLLFGIAAVRHTHLTFGSIAYVYSTTATFASFCLSVGFSLRFVLNTNIFLEGLAVCVGIGIATLLRMTVDKKMFAEFVHFVRTNAGNRFI